MQPGDRLICIFVDPMKLGDKFKDWLLHITVVPWFRYDKKSHDVVSDIGELLKGATVFELSAGNDAYFGFSSEKLVTLIKSSSTLRRIEKIIRLYLHKTSSLIIDETTQLKKPFRPHVTVQGRQRLKRGQHILVDKLYLVEQKGDYKIISGIINLSQ